MVSLDKVTALLARHESFRSVCYCDTRGRVTIGYGTNLDAPGAADHCAFAGVDYAAIRHGALVTREQGQVLLQHAAQHAMDCALIIVRGLTEMPENVQLVVVDMIYNLGTAGFGEFHETIAALERKDWRVAADCMRESLWYEQVGVRGKNDVALVMSALGQAGRGNNGVESPGNV